MRAPLPSIVLVCGLLGCGARSELRTSPLDASTGRDASADVATDAPRRDVGRDVGRDVVVEEPPLDVLDVLDEPPPDVQPDAPPVVAGPTRCGPMAQSPLRFDGRGSRIVTAPSPRFEPGAGDFAVEVWFAHDPTQTNSYPMLISHRSTNPFDAWFLGLEPEGHLWMQIAGVNPPRHGVAGPVVRDGRCHFAAGSRRDGVLRLFVDGEFTVEFQHAGDASVDDPTQGFWIGHDRARSDNTAWLGGIYDVRVYARALGDDEVRRHVDEDPARDEPGLVGWWVTGPDPSDPQRVPDRSPTGAHATLGARPTADSADPTR